MDSSTHLPIAHKFRARLDGGDVLVDWWQRGLVSVLACPAAALTRLTRPAPVPG